jgi:hypothetical protein
MNDQRDMDRPRAIAALFDSEASGVAALARLHDAGFTEAWLGVTRALKDHKAFSEVVRERGGGRFESFVRIFSGNGGESLYAALTDHGVAEDVARRLSADMPERGVVVIAGWKGDLTIAARVLTEAGGSVVRGADDGVIGTPRPRQPGPTV